MSFVFTLLIIFTMNYLAIALWMRRHRKLFSNLPDINTDVSLKKKKKATIEEKVGEV
jgi:hypothetical protein|nr:hypothetical protein [uncultured Lachnoclostridium sp.]